MKPLEWWPGGLPTPRHFRLRSVETFVGRRIVVVEGDGNTGTPYSECTYWLDEDNRVIARYAQGDSIDTARGPGD